MYNSLLRKKTASKLSFYDGLIIREGYHLKTDWYKKFNVVTDIILAHKGYDKKKLKRIKTILTNNNYSLPCTNSRQEVPQH